LQPQQIDTAAGIASAEAADGVAQEQLQQMQLARTRLLQADQDVLRLFYDERRPYEEIASLLGISINAVGPKLDRARRRLKLLLQQPADAARPPD
jgi:RNA polymerase sigma factor (sigma-70 family)